MPGRTRSRAINTLSGMAVAPGSARAAARAPCTAGLSGPAIKPVALRIVYEAVQAVKIPVVAVGGVTELADVLDFLAVGAVAVQVGTAVFADPTLPVRLVDELAPSAGAAACTSYRRSSEPRCRHGPAGRRPRASSTGRSKGNGQADMVWYVHVQ